METGIIPPEQPQDDTDKKDREQNRTQKLLFGIVTEIALVFWMGSEYLTNVEHPRASAFVLLAAILFVLAFIVLTLLEFSWFHKRKASVWAVFSSVCLASIILFWSLLNSFLEKTRLSKEPFVSPTVVGLHQNGYDKLTRVLIANPSDSWIYKVTVLIHPVNNAVPIDAIESHLADPLMTDKFTALSNQKQPGFVTGTDIGFDVVFPGLSSGRLLILYSLAPKENRALWLLGHTLTDSWARIAIVEYSRMPLSISVATNGIFLWPGPRKNSPFWTNFPNAEPMDLDFGSKVNDPNPPTNTSKSLEMPSKPPSRPSFRLQ